jgi:SAM-dependent methyltransferase
MLGRCRKAWREIRTRWFILKGMSDRVRWSDPNSYSHEWDSRAACAADLVAPGARVLDIGCGKMRLGQLLPPGCTYVGADLEPLSASARKVDLNRGEFPGGHYDYVIMLGVLGYLHNPMAVLQRARRHADRLIVSYRIAKNRNRKMSRQRLRDGYFNDFDERMLRDVLSCSGWALELVQTYNEDNLTRQDIVLCRAKANIVSLAV